MKDKKFDFISHPERQKHLKRLLQKKSNVNMKLWLGSKNSGFTKALDVWRNDSLNRSSLTTCRVFIKDV